jgi:hypothetical protein
MDTQSPAIPLHGRMEDLLTGETADCCTLPPYGFAIYKSM